MIVLRYEVLDSRALELLCNTGYLKAYKSTIDRGMYLDYEVPRRILGFKMRINTYSKGIYSSGVGSNYLSVLIGEDKNNPRDFISIQELNLFDYENLIKIVNPSPINKDKLHFDFIDAATGGELKNKSCKSSYSDSYGEEVSITVNSLTQGDIKYTLRRFSGVYNFIKRYLDMPINSKILDIHPDAFDLDYKYDILNLSNSVPIMSLDIDPNFKMHPIVSLILKYMPSGLEVKIRGLKGIQIVRAVYYDGSIQIENNERFFGIGDYKLLLNDHRDLIHTLDAGNRFYFLIRTLYERDMMYQKRIKNSNMYELIPNKYYTLFEYEPLEVKEDVVVGRSLFLNNSLTRTDRFEEKPMQEIYEIIKSDIENNSTIVEQVEPLFSKVPSFIFYILEYKLHKDKMTTNMKSYTFYYDDFGKMLLYENINDPGLNSFAVSNTTYQYLYNLQIDFKEYKDKFKGFIEYKIQE